jgi:ribokinase
LCHDLKAEGITTKFVSADPTSPTGLAVVLVEDSGQNRILVYAGANMKLTVEQVETALRDEYEAVLLQLEVPDAVVAASVRAAQRKRVPVVLDAGPARPFDLKLITGIDILSPNQSEAEALTGLPCKNAAEAGKAARRLRRLSAARHVVIKMGAAGAFLLTDAASEMVPAFQVKAVDPTAAGDSFTAGLALEWLRTGDLRRAVRYGNAAGALSAMTIGAQPSLPTAAEVDDFLARICPKVTECARGMFDTLN